MTFSGELVANAVANHGEFALPGLDQRHHDMLPGGAAMESHLPQELSSCVTNGSGHLRNDTSTLCSSGSLESTFYRGIVLVLI